MTTTKKSLGIPKYPKNAKELPPFWPQFEPNSKDVEAFKTELYLHKLLRSYNSLGLPKTPEELKEKIYLEKQIKRIDVKVNNLWKSLGNP